MTEQNYLDLLNGVIAIALPVNSNDIELISLDEPMVETGLDSFDRLMVAIYLSEIYGVSDETMKELQAVTARDVVDFMVLHKTKEPASVKDALESIK
jgi:acyl carrier protein